MEHQDLIKQNYSKLIDLMRQQVTDPDNQSFGSLEHHLDAALKAYETQQYLNPLYSVKLQRWLGEYGNTDLEENIYAIANILDRLSIEINGGLEVVNKIRKDHNEGLESK